VHTASAMRHGAAAGRRGGLDVAALGRAGAALLVAGAVGALSTSHPLWAVAVVCALVLAILLAVRVSFLLMLLVSSMFVESLSLGGGFAVGRLAGALAFVVIAYILFARGHTGLGQNALLLVAGCYGAWMLLSVYWASSAGAVFQQLLSYGLAIAYALAFALLVRSRRDMRGVLATFTFGAFVFGLVALAEYLSTGGATRASGLQGDPNYFAEYQVIALPAVLALAALERRWRLACYGVAGVIILSVFSSLSRGGLVALVVVIAATIVLPWRTFFVSAKEKGLYAFAILLGIGLSLLLGSGALLGRVGSIFHPGADRGAGRLDLWSAAWRAWKQHPWLGIGEGNFPVRSLDLLQTTPGVNTAASYVSAGREVHNAYLETLTELGPIGLLLFLLVIVLTAFSFLVVSRRARDAGDTYLARVSVALLFSLIVYAVTAFFLSSELQKPLWILVGLAVALDVVSRRLPSGVGKDGALARASLAASHDQEVSSVPFSERLI
jgi:O-antigen ligase